MIGILKFVIREKLGGKEKVVLGWGVIFRTLVPGRKTQTVSDSGTRENKFSGGLPTSSLYLNSLVAAGRLLMRELSKYF